jgi:hypothetical protein
MRDAKWVRLEALRDPGMRRVVEALKRVVEESGAAARPAAVAAREGPAPHAYARGIAATA